MLPSCTLDADGRESQTARYRTVARAMTGVRREHDAVLVDFSARLDPAVLDEIVATERECCPWLRFEFDRIARQLAVSVTDTAMLPALEAIADAFTGTIR
jgi:hypothetical protein